MTTHLSVRICWHDSGWNGRICSDPKQNNFCTFLEHIRIKKDKEFEDIEVKYRKKSLSEPGLDCNEIDIPCGGEIGVYSEKSYDVKFVHPLKVKCIPGYDLDPCIENLKPYSFYPAPYRWLMMDNFYKIWRKENIDLRILMQMNWHQKH